jgi:HSP20 family molecular chaperone IbpA
VYSDFNQLSRFARLFSALMPSLDAKPLLAELRDRVAEEFDYRLEADAQKAFATAYAGDPNVCVPRVVSVSDHMLVSEWLDGIRWPGSSPRARPLNGTGRAPRSSVSCSRVLRGSGSCTRIRTLATSASLPTGGSACSTSALSTGYQTASCRPPTYSSIGHRHLAWAVLCQLECEAPFRAEVLRWIPGYVDPAKPGPQPQPPLQPACARSAPQAGSAPPATAGGHAGSAPQAGPEKQKRSMPSARVEPQERMAQSLWLAGPEQITWSDVQWRDVMAKLSRPQAPERFRALFPELADWLESRWTGPPPFLTGQVFRLEESFLDDRYVIRAELPGLDPENDIEVTVDGRILTIRAERRQQDKGPYRSEFRYGSLARTVKLPARVDPADVTARYDKGVLEVSVPVHAIKPEGTRITVENADGVEQQPDQAGEKSARQDADV